MSNSSASTSATPTTPSPVTTPSRSASPTPSPSSSASTIGSSSISSSTTQPPSSSSSSISTTTSSQSTATSSSTTPITSSSASVISSSTSSSQTFTTSSTSGTSTFFQTTVITTDAQGSVVTILTTAAASNTPGTAATTNTGSTSHTGAIVGGVVGGVAGLAILAFVLIFCLRRQRRKDDFDGNFDPDRVAHSQGPLDLAAGEVEPYTYPQENAHAGGQTDMREAPLAGGSTHQFYNASSTRTQPDYEGSRSLTDTHTTTSFLSPNAAPVAGVAYAPSSSSHSPPRSAKEREAFSRYNTVGSSGSGNAPQAGTSDSGMHVVNQPDDGVVVHQDGGRVRIPVDEEQVEREIPPTYDSIPADSRR